jgi:hypothetical protein
VSGFSSARLILEDFPPARWRYSRTKPPADLARVLSPNGRYDWYTRWLATRYVQARVWLAVRSKSILPVSPPARLQLTYVRPTQRARDTDNWTSGVTKALIDGLVKSKVLAGDDAERLQLSPVRLVVEPGHRYLLAEIAHLDDPRPALQGDAHAVR